MSHKLTIPKAPEADLAEAYQWYESQRKGLGEDFLLCVDDALAKIARNPKVYAKVYKEIRRASLKRFPFAVFFVENDATVSVLAVIHAHRDPDIWMQRYH
jgi:plasmid stabilization system protein ParE